MNSLRDLYQSMIIDHSRHPRHFGELPTATHHQIGRNTVCGDELTLHFEVVNDTIKAVSFTGSGCAISKASASLMTDELIGKTVPEAHSYIARVHEAVLTGTGMETLGKLAVLDGVREFPMRVKCATLAWHAARVALSGETDIATTE